MASFRVQPSSMAIGEAAGVGVALAAQAGIALADLPAADVQTRLRATGGILDSFISGNSFNSRLLSYSTVTAQSRPKSVTIDRMVLVTMWLVEVASTDRCLLR